jgi:signal transduction histidine kinase
VTDTFFNDRYGYLTIIDNHGRVLYNRITGANYSPTDLEKSPDGKMLYVSHSVPFLPSFEDLGDTSFSTAISLLDGNLNKMKSVDIGAQVDELWLFDYKMDGQLDLYAQLNDNSHLIFDLDLNLLAKTDKAHLGNYLGEIKLEGRDHPAMVFSRNGLTFYSHNFRKLADLSNDYGFHYYGPVLFDEDSSVLALFAASNTAEIRVAINRQGILQIIGIYIYEYRYYLIAILFTFLGGIIVMNYYRIRTRKNLKLIANQKRELELATETIAEQRAKEAAVEQYKIAAGQFRHEINNALGAVKDYVNNLIYDPTEMGYKSQIHDRMEFLRSLLVSPSDSIPYLTEEMKVNIKNVVDDIGDLNTRIINGLDEIVLKGVNTGLNLADRLGKYERIEEDETYLQINLKSLVENIIQENSVRLSADNISFEINISDNINLKGSEELFSILFRNLLNNSIDAIRENSSTNNLIQIDAKIIDDVKILILWKDTGIGIPESDYDKVFKPFYTTKPTTGSGLGLSIVKRIVEKYKGEIKLESETGKYTQFTVVFPLI